MSKKHKREPITLFKPQPAICSCDQGNLCEEIKSLRVRLESQRSDTECYKRLYNTTVNDNGKLTREILCLREQLEKAGIAHATTDKALTAYRRAYNVMRIINIIFTVGFAVMTAILIWR
jgi:regulator of replication initiation timing